MTPEENFAKLGLTLPPAPKPLGVYKPFLIDGKHCYVSGHGTIKEDGTFIGLWVPSILAFGIYLKLINNSKND